MPCYMIHPEGGGTAFLCGDLGPHCGDANCGDVGTHLCDYPVGNGKTCDMPLCHGHAFEAAPEIHYCPGHALMWREFRERKENWFKHCPYCGREIHDGSVGASI